MSEKDLKMLINRELDPIGVGAFDGRKPGRQDGRQVSVNAAY